MALNKITDEIPIPDFIENFNPDASFKNDDASYKKQSKRSGFLITINPNCGRKCLIHKAQRIIEYKKLYRAMKHIEQQFKTGHYIRLADKNNGIKPKVTDFDFKIEIGESRNGLHSHVIVGYDGECRITNSEIAKDMEAFYMKKCMVSIKYINLYGKNAVMDYINKAYTDKTDSSIKPLPQPIINKLNTE